MKKPVQMKNLIYLTLIIICFTHLSVQTVEAATPHKTAPKKKPMTAKPAHAAKQPVKQPIKQTVKQPASKPSTTSGSSAEERALNNALELAKAGKYLDASMRLFNLSRNPRLAADKMRIKYILGLMLYEMKLDQVASYQFVAVVKDGNSKYIKKALEKLSIASSYLNDHSLINYAITKVDLADFPKSYQDMLRFRIGEHEYENKLTDKAIRSLEAVPSGSSYFSKSRYLKGMAYLETGRVDEAISSFQEIIDARKEFGVTDNDSVAAQMAVARAKYQKKDFEGAISVYRDIPRDTFYWHDSLLEISWAELRGGKFRSVLSNFQTIHSPFYDDKYQPESMLLRGILYLYICQHLEMQKTLDMFEQIYTPVHNRVKEMLASSAGIGDYATEMIKITEAKEELMKEVSKRGKYKIPYIIARAIQKEPAFKTGFDHYQKLRAEKRTWATLPSAWRNSAVGKYSSKLLENRIKNAEMTLGVAVKDQMAKYNKELSELFEQESFARYELVNMRKERIKKGLAELPEQKKVDDDNERSFYIQNGYDYYPFAGEYWLDEIGNYYYLGQRSCE